MISVKCLVSNSTVVKQKLCGLAPKQTAILGCAQKKNFKWPFKKVKALGVWLSTDPEITVSQNYKLKKNWRKCE